MQQISDITPSKDHPPHNISRFFTIGYLQKRWRHRYFTSVFSYRTCLFPVVVDQGHVCLHLRWTMVFQSYKSYMVHTHLDMFSQNSASDIAVYLSQWILQTPNYPVFMFYSYLPLGLISILMSLCCKQKARRFLWKIWRFTHDIIKAAQGVIIQYANKECFLHTLTLSLVPLYHCNHVMYCD